MNYILANKHMIVKIFWVVCLLYNLVRPFTGNSLGNVYYDVMASIAVLVTLIWVCRITNKKVVD